jgi:uncharacterized membrane protein YjgN (DUF898 family)
MNRFKFEGKGLDFFKIHFVNLLLCIVSLTFLYPWARVREFRYLWSRTSLGESPFDFSGSVKKFFRGYIWTLIFLPFCFLLGYALGFLTTHFNNPLLSVLTYPLLYLIIFAVVCFFTPIILHGSLNYRLDSTSWRSVTPSYRGKLSELVPLYVRGAILTALTAGIYSAWFQVKFYTYILKNTHFGSLRFDFSGKAKPLFLIYLKGFLLCLVTCGIYSFWFFKALYEYSVNNIVVRKDEQEFKLQSNANTLEVFEMMLGNFLLTFLTLGLGLSWVYMRYNRFVINHCVIPADFNIDAIENNTMEEEPEAPSQHWLDRWNPIIIA